MTQLTILMPCLNEAETIRQCIAQAQGWVASSGLECEILIADNGSTDGSIEIAESMGARVVRVPERGYGAALFAGCDAAQGQWIIFGDADASYDFSKLDPFVVELTAGADVVMGNRFRGGIAPGAMPWKNRYVGNPLLSWLGRRLFGIKVGDFHCGLRALTKSAFDRLDLRTTGMEFASEMVVKAAQLRLRMTEVPTTLSKDGRSRPPHLRPWRDGWRHLRFMVLCSPRWLFVIPGLLLLVVSLLGYARLLVGPWDLGQVTLDVHTLFFFQAGVTLGLLATLTGVVARTIGARDGLLPEHAALRRLQDWPIAEIGAVIGAALFLFGVGWAGEAVITWGSAGFGELAVGDLLRTISFATLLLTVGGIALVFSLMLGFVSLPTRPPRLRS
jgi:hypothetical protein